MQRVIGIVLGAGVTYLLLTVMIGINSETTIQYGLAVVIGAVVALLWPWLIGLFLVRRRKARRDARIQQEVERQVAGKG